MAIQVDPENVVGRDQLIERIWRKLDKGSIRFTAESRVGETTVMTKMAADSKEGFEVLFMELEGIDSPDRFVELLISRVKPLLSKTDKAKNWWNDFRSAMGGTDVAGSVGLHHVVTDLKQGTLASEPTNDMPLVEIRALSKTVLQQLTSDHDPVGDGAFSRAARDVLQRHDRRHVCDNDSRRIYRQSDSRSPSFHE